MKLRSWMLILAMVGGGFGGLGACGKRAKKDEGPSCRQIVSYMMRFKEFGAFDERTAINECRQQRWTAQQRQCLYTAKDLDGMMECIPKIELDTTGKRRLPLPSWHPNLEKPLQGKVEHRPSTEAPAPMPPQPAQPAEPAPSPGPMPAPATPAAAPMGSAAPQ